MRRALLALGLASTLSLPAHAEYFLDARQKGELISRGEISGRDGARYNVWIVPGYVVPAQNAAEGWRAAGQDLKEYGDPALYRNARKHSRDTFRFARRDIIREFAFVGTGRTWVDSFGTASERVDKRVFGWWFAYPWALLEATGASALRVGLGVPTGVAVGLGGVTALPAVELMLPTLKAGYHSTVDGFAVPVLGMSWNTVVAPPLALLGEQPSPERADGFWMKRIDPVTSDVELQAALQALSAWRAAEVATTPARAVTEAEQAAMGVLDARRQALLRELEQERRALHEAAQARLLALLQSATARAPAPDQLGALAQRHGRRPFINALRGPGVDEATARLLLATLLGDQDIPDDVAPPLRPDAEKTNPVKRSFELMEE
ncbi:MAG: hypothetical protein V4729_13115 [Pseudomonadota bacterium]